LGSTTSVDHELAAYTSPREWWQVATRHNADPVEFVIPTHNR
jgi:hypothetical protein